MNRTAAAALASLLAFAGTACGPGPVPPPPYTDVTFFWQLRDWNGNLYGDFSSSFPGCDLANVDEVRITIDAPGGSFTQRVPCVAVTGMPGAIITNVPTGPITWYVEGLRLDFPVFAYQGGGDGVNFPTFYLTLDAVYPNMDLYYEFPPGVNCTGISEIQFELWNLDAQLVEYSSRNALVDCRPFPDNGFTMPSIPVGNLYGYTYVAAVDSLGFSLYQTCGFGIPPDPPLVQGPDGSAYTALLAPTLGQCP